MFLRFVQRNQGRNDGQGESSCGREESKQQPQPCNPVDLVQKMAKKWIIGLSWALIFLSLVFGIALVFSNQGNSLVFWVFSAAFPCFSKGFPGLGGGKKSLVFRVVFLGFYLNTKEWKIREVFFSSHLPCEIAEAYFLNQTVSNATFAYATLVFDFFVRFYFRWWVHLRKGNPLSLKQHLFLHGNRVKIQIQGILDLFFDAAPHLEYFFQFFELSTKAAFAKAAFDTLRLKARFLQCGYWPRSSQILIWILPWIFGWFCCSCFCQGKRPKQIHQKKTCKIHLGLCSENSPRISAQAFNFWISPAISRASPQILIDFQPISVIFNQFQSVAISFSRFYSGPKSVDSVENAVVYWQQEGGENNAQLTREMGPEEWAKMGRKRLKNGVSRQLSLFFGPFLPPYRKWGQDPFFGHFLPHFGPEARNGSVPDPRDLKTVLRCRHPQRHLAFWGPGLHIVFELINFKLLT